MNDIRTLLKENWCSAAIFLQAALGFASFGAMLAFRSRAALYAYAIMLALTVASVPLAFIGFRRDKVRWLPLAALALAALFFCTKYLVTVTVNQGAGAVGVGR